MNIGYCTGPAQLVYLLSAWEDADVPLEDCKLLVFKSCARNDDLQPAVEFVAEKLGIPLSNGAEAPDSSFWYCRGVPHDRFAAQHMTRLAPARVYEYYDGFRSTIVARELDPSRQMEVAGGKVSKKLKNIWKLNPFKTLAAMPGRRRDMKLLAPDRIYMPWFALWDEYAGAAARSITDEIGPDTLRSKIELVGRLLDEFSSAAQPTAQPSLIILTSAFAERRTNQEESAALLEGELSLCRDILKAVGPDKAMIKTHPRSSVERLEKLNALCSEFGAILECRQQLVESIVMNSGRDDIVVVGPPGTAHLTISSLELGRSACYSMDLVVSYLGSSYGTDYLTCEDHKLMDDSGVDVINGAGDVTAALSK